MAPSLCSLPAELVEHIANYLSDYDLLDLRLACADINAKISPYFARVWFSDRYISLSRESLQDLLDVSAHPTFGPCVRRIQLSARYLWDPEVDRSDSLANRAERDAYASLDGEAQKDYRRKVYEERYVREMCLDKEMLTTALRALPNCRKIDFYEDSEGVSQHLLSVALASILSSQITLEEFEVPNFNAVKDPGSSVFYIPTWELDRFRIAFSHLKCLSLSLNTWRWNDRHGGSLLTSLGRYLSVLDLLEELTLSAQCDTEVSGNVLDYCAKAADVKLPQLHRLEFSDMDMEEKDLIAFATKFKKTLKALWVIGVGLTHGTWQSVFSVFKDGFQLNDIHLTDLYQNDEGVGLPKASTTSYQGDEMHQFLAGLTAQMKTPDHDDDDDDDDDDEEEEGEEEEEEGEGEGEGE